MMKKETGITLVALIITIIVMLILVGVSIRVVVNSGILGIAKNVGNSTEIAYNEESNFGGVITIENKKYASVEDYQAGKRMVETETPGGTRVTTKTEYEEHGQTAIIPAGFTISGISEERKIDEGLVIYLIPEGTTVDWTDATAVVTAKRTYDQFVWIPIENINEMFICQGKTASNGACTITVENGKVICKTLEHDTIIVENENTIYKNTLMAGRLYAQSLRENFDASLTTQAYTSGSGLREPDVVPSRDGNSNYLTQLPGILGTEGYETKEDFKETLQEEYNEIVESVYENKGFWVGRYETSGMVNSNPESTDLVNIPQVKVVAGTTTGIRSVTWYRMYGQQKKYAEKNGLQEEVKSGMILGAMYDQVLKFVVTASYNITTAGNVGHTSDQGITRIYQTGGLNYPAGASVAYNDYSKNIYDLEGNVWERTTEADDSNVRIVRGRLLLQQRFSELS